MTKWTPNMCQLLLWMRSEKMPFSFCAEVIGREVKRFITKNACVGKHRRLIKDMK